MSNTPYVGRFAPSPSGPLHFGSLVAALASFLDAKANKGLWLMRMEDLDPAREPIGAAGQILATLEILGLEWDGPVLYQSQRLENYAQALSLLEDLALLYQCGCTRAQIRGIGGVYDNRCRTARHTHKTTATRVAIADCTIQFEDRIQGPQSQDLMRDCGDFVLLRKDGLFAYQLAVIVDDAYQRVTDIVRGIDLLDSTPRQIYLQQQFAYKLPNYAHIPVVVNDLGQKLSKQHFAKALDLENPAEQLHKALQFLGQSPDPSLRKASPAQVIKWAVEHWDIQAVPKLANIRLDDVV
jgi:glutamyl-Q tRNA(Asp) synthetase